MQQETEQNVLAAQGNALAKERLTRAYEDFIQRAASRTVGREIQADDEEWSIARFAFLRAIGTFSPDKGRFLPYAELLIRHRLADHYRLQKKYLPGYHVTPEVLGGEPEETPIAYPARKRTAISEEQSIREEIKAARRLLGEYGFTLFDLTACSPRTEKARKQCADAIGVLIVDPALTERMRGEKRLPIQELQAACELSRRTLERHKKYIIAATELLLGEFPRLNEYLKGIGEETAP